MDRYSHNHGSQSMVLQYEIIKFKKFIRFLCLCVPTYLRICSFEVFIFLLPFKWCFMAFSLIKHLFHGSDGDAIFTNLFPTKMLSIHCKHLKKFEVTLEENN